MSKIRLGIDIGGKGAVAVFKNDKLDSYWAFPRIADRPDLRTFVDQLLVWTSDCESIHVVMEDLHAIFGTSAKSNFSFGWINGAIETVLITLNIPYTKVGAKKWQKELWEGVRSVEIISKQKKEKGIPAAPKLNKDGTVKYKIDTKATSLLAAKRLFPTESFLATERSKVPHDGIVDAVLIGEYCRRHF